MLKRSTRNDIIVGMFVLIAMGFFMYMTFLVQGTSGSNPVRLQIIYPEVAALELGSPVLISGFRAGRVMRMEAIKSEDGRQEVIVHAEVSRAINLYNDAKFHLRQQGFIGDKRIEIDPGSAGAGLLDTSRPVRGIPYRDLTDMLAGSEEIIGNLNAVLENARSFTSDQERIARIDESLANVAASSRQVAEILAENRESIRQITQNAEEVTRRSVEIAARTEEILGEARRSVDQLNAMIAQLNQDREAVVGRVDRVLANAENATGKATELVTTADNELRTLSNDIQEAARELTEMLAKVNRGEGTAARLLNDPAPIEELQTSITAFRRLLIEDRRQGIVHNPTLEYRQSPEASPLQAAGN